MRLREHGLRHSIWQAMRRPVSPSYRGYLAFGWPILMLFLVQIVTGVLLSFYYEPSPDMAYESLKFIMRDVSSGWLIRGIHHWAAEGMIAFGLLQIMRIFITGAYKGPGRSSWHIGIILLVFLFSFAFTGNLLAWDQKAFWSTAIALQWVEAIPLLGPHFAVLLRGGQDIGASTLSRFYSTHTMLLPWLSFYLILLHLWLLSRPSRTRAEEA